MRASCYLVFNRYGMQRMTKGRPTLGAGQHAVLVTLDIPSTVFQPEIPTIEATVAPGDVLRPTVTVWPNPEPVLPLQNDDRGF